MQKNRVLLIYHQGMALHALMIAGKSCFVLEIIMCPHLFLHQQGSRVEFQAEAEGAEIIAVNEFCAYLNQDVWAQSIKCQHGLDLDESF